MAKEMKFLYTITTRTPARGEILLGNVVATNPGDAILEFVTTRSSDPLDCYADKVDASRHLDYFRKIYRVEVARKDGRPNGRSIRVKNR